MRKVCYDYPVSVFAFSRCKHADVAELAEIVRWHSRVTMSVCGATESE